MVGNDYQAQSREYEKIRAQALADGKEIVPLSPVDATPDEAREHLLAADIFGASKLVVLRGFTDDAAVREAVVASSHHVVLIEESLAAEAKKFFKKYEHVELQEFKASKKDDKSIFGLASAFRSRDPKTMWLTYRQLVDNGTTAHQMIGIVWWQLKSMLLVKHDPQGHELKPFVATQASKALAKYPNSDLEEKAQALLDVYHLGHLDGSLEGRFEEWVLGY